ncbi:hypothetical protein [Lederbergia citri]|uniref:Uncharacterized protein n=1 Tax=Lederbergia citri TaxID=2833580 RepID=A0A942YGR9_9BACI|nr:hypothetical protein [Lederbergia citri]MBS4195797.1 hypothetical protein [Lederbergia citri]
MNSVKDGLNDWLNELIEEKDTTDKLLNNHITGMKLSQIKLSILDSAFSQIPNNDDMKKEFRRKFVEVHEMRHNELVEIYEERRLELIRQSRYLGKLIQHVEITIREY